MLPDGLQNLSGVSGHGNPSDYQRVFLNRVEGLKHAKCVVFHDKR